MIAPTLLASAALAPEPSQLAVVPAAMRQYVDQGDIAGAVTLVAREGRILEFDAVGLADIATKRPMKKDTLFWVASMTKPITSAAILMLVDEGRIALEDPLEKYLPEFQTPWMVAKKRDDRIILERPPRLVTIRDLLSHTHGLDEPPLPVVGTPLSGLVAMVARGLLQFPPGTQWKYGNAGMSVLGRVVEVVSGMPFEEFLRTRFFEPLGMGSTTFYPDTEPLQGMAKSYNRPVENAPLAEVSIVLINGDPAKKEQTVLPGAGLFSTAEDMFRFYQMILNGGEFAGRRYLAESTVKEMLTSQTGDLEAGFSAGMAWGLGVGIVKSPQGWTDVLPVGCWGHDGAYGTTVMADPGRGLLFLMMIQRAGLNPAHEGLRFRHGFHAAVMRTFFP